MDGVPDRPVRRILMTTDTVGGVWTFTLELAQQLAGFGVEVVLATLGGLPNPEQTAEALRVANLSLITSAFKLEWGEDPWRDVEESGRWLMRLERDFQPDLIHLNAFGNGDLPWPVPVVLTAHSCVLSWWKAVRHQPAPAAWNRYRETVARSLRAVDLVAVPSNSMAAALADNYNFESAVVVIPNGRSREPFYSAPKEPFVLTAGRLWDEAKNARAVARAADKIPWPVFAAGDAGTPEQQGELFANTRMLGRLSTTELASWYSRAAIFALPARYEPFGLAAVEAALSGCALVLGDIASQREIWGDAALFVPPDDQAALTTALNSLIANAGLRREMSRRSYLRALTFHPADTARRYLQAYRAAVSLRNVACVS
jgi:glycogen(starch) synthase